MGENEGRWEGEERTVREREGEVGGREGEVGGQREGDSCERRREGQGKGRRVLYRGSDAP